MHIRIIQQDGTFVTNIPFTSADLMEKLEYCKSKYPSPEYHADLIIEIIKKS